MTEGTSLDHPLLGPVLKFNRAQEHLGELNMAVSEFVKSDFYEIAADHDHQGRPIARVIRAESPPPELSVLIGECVFNWRSGLDQLAYQLALDHLGDPLPQEIDKSSAFPIFNNGPKFRWGSAKKRTRSGRAPNDSGLHKIRGVSRPARAAIERLQPYHRRKNPALKALWVLEQLSNIDKHRLLHLTGSALKGSSFELQTTGQFVLHKIEVFPRPLNAGAMLARFTIETGPDSHMNVTHHMLIDVVFDKRSPVKDVRGQSVIHTLNWIGVVIAAEVMPELAPLLPGEWHVTVGEAPGVTHEEPPVGWSTARVSGP